MPSSEHSFPSINNGTATGLTKSIGTQDTKPRENDDTASTSSTFTTTLSTCSPPVPGPKWKTVAGGALSGLVKQLVVDQFHPQAASTRELHARATDAIGKVAVSMTKPAAPCSFGKAAASHAPAIEQDDDSDGDPEDESARATDTSNGTASTNSGPPANNVLSVQNGYTHVHSSLEKANTATDEARKQRTATANTGKGAVAPPNNDKATLNQDELKAKPEKQPSDKKHDSNQDEAPESIAFGPPVWASSDAGDMAAAAPNKPGQAGASGNHTIAQDQQQSAFGPPVMAGAASGEVDGKGDNAWNTVAAGKAHHLRKERGTTSPIGMIRVITARDCQTHVVMASSSQKEASAPKILIPGTCISDVSLCKVGSPSKGTEEPPPLTNYIILTAWLVYDLDYAVCHSPITPLDPRKCLDDAFQHSNVQAVVHLVKTRGTKTEPKGFRMTFDVWVHPSSPLPNDDYLVAKLLALNTAVNLVVQQCTWRTACNNEHAPSLKIAFPANSSVVDTPELLVTGLNPVTHGTSRSQLLHITNEFFTKINP